MSGQELRDSGCEAVRCKIVARCYAANCERLRLSGWLSTLNCGTVAGWDAVSCEGVVCSDI